MNRSSIAALVAASALIAGPAIAGHQSKYVTEVEGTARYGFVVDWGNGDRWHMPTKSEALAECEAYGKVRRAKCRTKVRVTYKWVGITKRSLNHDRVEPCRDEDGPGLCYWDGSVRGNGQGASYLINRDGSTTYLGGN